MTNKLRTHVGHPARSVLGTGLLVGVILSLLAVGVALAAGNVTGYAWGTNVGWINFNDHGFSGFPAANVYTNHLEGYIWGENIGWIRLGSDGGVPGNNPYYANTTKDNYGVNYNNSTGELSGYAWGTNVGWINFKPVNPGVTIDTTTGAFNGYAWGENVGWIRFRSTVNPTYGVTTSAPTAVTLRDLRGQALSLVD
jgi:hypothetical protein